MSDYLTSSHHHHVRGDSASAEVVDHVTTPASRRFKFAGALFLLQAVVALLQILHWHNSFHACSNQGARPYNVTDWLPNVGSSSTTVGNNNINSAPPAFVASLGNHEAVARLESLVPALSGPVKKEEIKTTVDTTERENALINFVHIPKAAGTTVEAVSLQNSHQCGLWGSRMKGNKTLETLFPWTSGEWVKKARLPGVEDHPEWEESIPCTTLPACAEWHIPPAWLPPKLRDELYKPADTFCIIRDPLERLISHYYYTHSLPKSQKVNTTENVNGTNQVVQKVEKRYIKGPCFNDTMEYTNNFLANLLRKALDSITCDCHIIPQSYFLAESVLREVRGSESSSTTVAGQELGGNSPAWPQCNRVLIMEADLPTQFNHLMQDVQCPIRISVNQHKNHIHYSCKNETKFYTQSNIHLMGKPYKRITVSDLSEEVRKLANEMYADDMLVHKYYINKVRESRDTSYV